MEPTKNTWDDFKREAAELLGDLRELVALNLQATKQANIALEHEVVSDNESANKLFMRAFESRLAELQWTEADNFAVTAIVKNLLAQHTANQEDTNAKLSEAYGELSSLRHQANRNRVDGMIAVKGLVQAAYDKTAELNFGSHATLLEKLLKDTNELIALNLPQIEGEEADEELKALIV